MSLRLCIAAAFAAAGALAGAGAGAAEPLLLAQASDVRQEDRRADRREDRQEDRRADRRMDAEDNPAQVRVPLERAADGALDVSALLDAIAARVDEGAREIQIRNESPTQEEARALMLSVDAGQNLLARIGALLPGDGIERSVSFKGLVDARVQRQPDGSLRLNVRDIDIGDLAAAQLATDLATLTGFDRVRIRGVDAEGNRVRVEFRADKGLTHEQIRADRRGGRAERVARGDRIEREDRPDRSGPSERVERLERPDRSGPSERVERVERSESGNSGRH